ncbi:SurA N-terminal domain-containing protein [Kitasatospora sp. NA04385]|uniref:SurA N-terminal domain-containing protein n=1 Tax=Kitasatospora sp. NA04385 TaxID=2742135 RepID=UPI001590FA69|nr:SurA N-terminal domain-containing protein [Kitasatospora sp. NA04385]QKW21291.1 SurA N-terminal domain-containing protein [Kitasatospora sp. NA04385]
MIRTSSARRLRAALGTAVAAAALAACGGAPAHQGAAAVVGSDRISIAQVEARVAAVRDGAAQAGAAAEEQPGLARHAVSDLILGKVVARALADHRITVSQSEVDQARSADARTVGSDTKLAELLRAKQGVPSGDVDGFYRQQIGLVKLAAGQDPNSPAGDAAIRKALVDAGTALHIEVNPRYGSWDTARISLTGSTENWLPAASTQAL